MLVIISDLHLTDGSSGETIDAGAFRVFVDALERRAHAASWRKRGDGKVFEPIERCDLVLLGDVFDVIRSASWLQSGMLRPWARGPREADFASLVGRITDGILAHNAEALLLLRELGGQLRIPGAAPGELCEVPLHIHYMVGNHDWFYHLPGPELSAIRARIGQALALDNVSSAPFPHMLHEAEGALQEVFRAHRVYGQHGDIYDALNFERDPGRDYSSLGDCIVIELLNRFPHAVREALGLDPSDPLLAALREIDNVRPLLAIPRWVDSVLRRHAELPLRERVMDVWHELVDSFLAIPFVRAHDRPFRLDTVDFLSAALRWSAGARLSTLSRFSSEMERLTKGESLAKHAAAESALRERHADFVVYGHTHRPETIPIDVLWGGPREVEQRYFNSGTWRCVHERCIANPEQLEFARSHVMTYVAFYRDDERSGRRFETWTGQLG